MSHWRGGRLTTGAHRQPSAYSADTRTDTNIVLFSPNSRGECAAVLTLADQKSGEAAAIISRPDPADQEFAALILFSIVVAIPASIVMLMVMIVLESFY